MDEQPTRRCVFLEESTLGNTASLWVKGQIDDQILEGLEAFIRRKRARAAGETSATSRDGAENGGVS